MMFQLPEVPHQQAAAECPKSKHWGFGERPHGHTAGLGAQCNTVRYEVTEVTQRGVDRTDQEGTHS